MSGKKNLETLKKGNEKKSLSFSGVNEFENIISMKRENGRKLLLLNDDLEKQ